MSTENLFTISEQITSDVCFVPMELSRDPAHTCLIFANEYFEASKRLFDSFKERLIKRTGRYAEGLIFPALFLFRHSIELYFKGLICYAIKIKSGCIDYRSGKIKKLFNNHSLQSLYRELKSNWPEKGKLILSSEAEEVLGQLIGIDDGSQAFRYPFDNEYKPFIEDNMETNSMEVWKKIEDLGMQLSGQADGLAHLLEELKTNASP